MPQKQTKNLIVYQAYGNKEILYECLFSILTLLPSLSSKDNILILIYTDQPSFFQNIKQIPNYPPFHTETLTHETIQEWQGKPPFIHRLKIKLLQHCIENHNGNILYLDSDTAFLKSPTHLFHLINERQFLMHLKEGILYHEINPVFKKLHRFLKKNNYSLPLNGKLIQIPPTTAMWNAGVIGIPSSASPLLKQVLEFTDAMYPLYPRHIVEQFAFSFIFQQHGTILPCDDVIFHYWNFKEFRIILNSLFNFLFYKKDLTLFYSLYPHIQPWNLIQPKLEYEALPRWKKVWRKLIGQKWALPELDFEALLQN